MIKNKNKYCNGAIIIISFIFLLTNTVFAGTKVDVSSGKIIGKNGDYYFKIPVSWENYVTAERENSNGHKYVDKINFYYEPRDSENSRIFLMALFTYNVNESNYNDNEKVMLATDKYLFTTLNAKYNPYNSVNDRIIFGRFLVELGNKDFISSKIIIPKSITDDKSNTIIVNNNFLEDYRAVERKNELYLPLAEVGRKLGYDVKWYSGPRVVTLDKAKDSIAVNTNSKNQRAVFINDRVYMPVNFFMQQFNINIEVDVRNNVKIKG